MEHAGEDIMGLILGSRNQEDTLIHKSATFNVANTKQCLLGYYHYSENPRKQKVYSKIITAHEDRLWIGDLDKPPLNHRMIPFQEASIIILPNHHYPANQIFRGVYNDSKIYDTLIELPDTIISFLQAEGLLS